MRNSARLNGAIALAVVAGVVAVLTGLYWALPENSHLKDVAAIAQSVAATLAIAGGAVFAAYKLELFRDFEPHLTISHAINHRRIAEGYVHLDVTAALHNSSKVKVVLHGGLFLIQQISPSAYPTEGDEDPDWQAVEPVNNLYPNWPVIDEFSVDFGEQGLNIEPGQSAQEVFQFLVPATVKTVLIYYYLGEERLPEDNTKVWGIGSVYDIIPQQTPAQA